jgi:large subunit ribosomal protein L10
MHKDDKERVIADLTARLRATEALIVTDYRGLTMPQIDALRGRLLEHGAKFTVVKNTLTRRAATDAGVDLLLAMLEGPSAIAFIESEGDIVEVARALSESVRDTRVLLIRGGLMQGRMISSAQVEELAKLPPFDVLRAQVLGAITAPLTNMLALISAPLQNLVGLIEARIEQLNAGGAAAASVPLDAAASSESDADASQPGAAPDATADSVAATDGGETELSAGEVESEPESDEQEVDDGGS